MKFSFDPLSDFAPPVQKTLEDMAERAFTRCKSQFSSAANHVLPHCRFHVGGSEGNTGNLSGIHVTFADQRHLSKLSKESATFEQLIHHEMVHFFQSHLCGTAPFNYLPTWFHEGMADAFSGQCLIARNSHMNHDYMGLGGNAGWAMNYLMDKHRHLDFTRPPYDALYGSWGALFIYTVSEEPNIFPKHAVYGSDTYLHSVVGEEECAKALAIMKTAFTSGFDAALKQHKGKEQVLERDFRKFLAPN